MDIIIQSLGFTAGTYLEDFIRAKLSTLKGDRIVRANVILYKGPASEPANDYCEIRLEVPGNDPFVKKHSPHFETSVNECVEVLSHTLHKAKERATHRQADPAIIQDILLDAELSSDEDVELEDVVR
ncbi:MAG: HPF/RaiA family ribosome-associated protein [Bacteroidota bacterium]